MRVPASLAALMGALRESRVAAASGPRQLQENCAWTSLFMLDNAQDGWDSATITITSGCDGSEVLPAGTSLASGASGSVDICMDSSRPYEVSAGGGTYDYEIEWQIHASACLDYPCPSPVHSGTGAGSYAIAGSCESDCESDALEALIPGGSLGSCIVPGSTFSADCTALCSNGLFLPVTCNGGAVGAPAECCAAGTIHLGGVRQ